jgi:hypothetical protein
MKLQDEEERALNDAALLLKYAAESPKTLPDSVVAPIANAWKAREENAWSPEVSTKFWIAYSALCDLLKPVTLDTISAKTPIKSRRWVFFGEFKEVTLPQRTANLYRFLLIVLLVTAVGFGFIATTSNRMSEDIKELVTRGNTVALELTAAMATLKTDLDKIAQGDEDSFELSFDDPRIGADIRAKIAGLRDKFQDLLFADDMMNDRVNGIADLTLFFFPPSDDYDTGDLSQIPNLRDGYANIKYYYQIRRHVSDQQQRVFLFNGIYTALVPMLLGAVGACTFVLRRISDQIRDTTFSTTSPVRHSVRVLIGALAGVAVGLGGIVTNFGLSAAALAFVSGYAVEPVFATMDNIADKFRRGG